MSGYARSANLAAYRSAAAHGGVAASDPHRLILMLLDGALQRLATARGCMQRGELAQQAAAINRAVEIVAELQASLDMQRGGSIAANLGELYDYICRQLLTANSGQRVELLDESSALLQQIREAWQAIAPAPTL